VPVEPLTYISVAEAFIHTVDACGIDPREQTWPSPTAPPTPPSVPQTSNLGCVFSFMSLLYRGVHKLGSKQFLANYWPRLVGYKAGRFCVLTAASIKMTAPGTFCRLVAWKYTDVTEVLTAMRFTAL
jgi:hypothetical protein